MLTTSKIVLGIDDIRDTDRKKLHQTTLIPLILKNMIKLTTAAMRRKEYIYTFKNQSTSIVGNRTIILENSITAIDRDTIGIDHQGTAVL